MGVFIGASNNKLTRISVLRVKSRGVFSTVLAAVDDCEESCLAKLKRFGDFDVERTEEGILVWVVLFDTPNRGKLILELHDLTDVSAFAHFLLGRDGHGSELPLDGRRSLLLARRRLFLWQSVGFGGHVGNADDDGEKGRSGKDGHDDF